MRFAGALALATIAFASVAYAGKRDPHYARERAAAAREAERHGDAEAAHGKAQEAKAQWTDAAADFRQAIDASDAVDLYYELAVVENKLGQLSEAYKHLQTVTNSSGVKPEIVKKAQALLDDISGRVGTVKLTVTPDGAQIALGGNTIGTTPLADPLVLPEGTYTITITAPGFQPKDEELKVLAGSEMERKVALEHVPVAVTTHVEAPPPPPPPREKRPWYINKYVPLAVTGGLTIGFLGAAIGTGIEAVHWHGIFVNPSTNSADRATAQSRGRTFADVNDAMVAGAAVFAVGTAAVYYFLWMRHPHDTSNVSVAPWVQPETGGLAIAGSF